MANTVMPFIMFIFLFGVILLNVPVAFALFFTSIVFGLIFWGWNGLYVTFQGIFSLMNSWALVALPLFVFMSAILERSGVADELFTTFYKLFGRVRGSLAVIAIMLGYTIGAMSGVVAAAIASLALIIYPLMVRHGYDKKLAIGSVFAAGTLPQVVPPSFNMIVYGSVAGVSVGKLFAGGLGVGTVMALVFSAYVIVWSHLNKDKVPVFASDQISLREKIISLKYLIGPLAIIFGVLGSIFTGIATPTEASGVGAFLSLVYVTVRRKLNRKVLEEALLVTLKVTSMACWIMAGGSAFSSVFSGIGGKKLVVDLLLSLPAARITVLVFSLALIFFLGMFVDPVSIIMIMTPILTPAVVNLGYDPLWWGVVFTSMLLVSYLTPPVGLGLYYFKGAIEEVSMDEIYRAVIPFIVLQVIAIIIIILYPDVVLWFIRALFRG